MPDYWIRETRTSRDEPGASVVVGSDDEAYDGAAVTFEDAPKENDWTGLEARLAAYLTGQGVEGNILIGGADGSPQAL